MTRRGLAGRSADATLARQVTAFALAVALCLATAVPANHFWTTRGHALSEMRLEATIGAALVSEFAARRPEVWRYEAGGIERLLVVAVRKERETTERWQVLDAAGQPIVELPATLSGPLITVREPIFEADRVIGAIEVTRSLRPALLGTAWVAATAGALALSAFLALRLLPMRLLRRAIARSEHLAHHDALTGLPNRRRFAVELNAALRRAEKHGTGLAVLMIDLDRFKPVNDLHGHAAGDEVLRMVAERLRRAARQTDGVARLGGDEFALVADLGAGDGRPVDGAGGVSEAALQLASRVVAALDAPFELGPAVSVRLGCSVGVALSPQDGVEADALTFRADAALVRAKADGRGRLRFFEPSMETSVRARAALEAELRRAIAADEIEPHFQPLVELRTGRLIGFEMLARWATHATRAEVSPAEFIPVAEETGLIVPMTALLLRKACRAAAAWPEHLVLAVNVSSVHMRDRGLSTLVRHALHEAGLPAARLELELTESALMADFELSRGIMDELKALGVRLALDDFGTGHSSLRHLWMLPFDKIKIDADFIRAVPGDGNARKIVAAMLALGRSLDLVTVAEGVEDAAMAQTLLELGCQVGQGWHFGRPLPAADAQRLAHERSATPVGPSATPGSLVTATILPFGKGIRTTG